MRRCLAVLCFVVAGLAQPASAQQSSGAAPTAEVLAQEINALNAKAAAAEARVPQLSQALVDADAVVAKLTGSIGSERALASELVVKARKQAIGAYVRSDATAEIYALATVIAQEKTQDGAWSLGLMQTVNRHTIDIMKAARQRGSQASKELTAALTKRELARIAVVNATKDATAIRVQAGTVATKLTVTVAAQAPLTLDGMTTVAYDAYRRSAVALGAERSTCGLRWELLAAIGRTESGHGMGRLDTNGNALPPILGISIGRDTDGGAIDGTAERDHAVGPMQFIPSTWKLYGADGNSDGKVDINNIYDESLAAGRYLCVAAGNLTLNTKDGVTRAILAYNPNQEYLRTVGGRFEALAQDTASGWFSAATLPTPPPAATPVPGVTGGGSPPGQGTPAPTPVTEVRTFVVFGSSAPVADVATGDPLPAVCASPSVVFGGRAGFVRCVNGATVLDPCVVAPYDLTLAGCIGDPEKPVQLVRVDAALVAASPASGPPYLAVVLQGGDKCLPFADAAATASAVAAVQPNQTPTPSTTTTSTTTTSTNASTSTSSTTAAQTPTTTVAKTTTTRVTTVPKAAGYRCASGATIVGQPTVTPTFWTALVRQTGIADRTVPIARIIR